MLYASFGWFLEVLAKLIEKGKFINRGFLIGPYCPIYGIGMLSIAVLLSQYETEPIILFVMSIVICSILEYFTSLIMEMIFKARWWDYSRQKYNLNGRICLETMVPFGFLGVIIIYFVNPAVLDVLAKISITSLHAISIILLIVFVSDILISFSGTYKLNLAKLKLEDNTEEIKEKFQAMLFNRWGILLRLQKAFPNLNLIEITKSNFIERNKKLKRKNNNKKGSK
jgi:uncharacterized membrane protein